jgi:hypothetical protein
LLQKVGCSCGLTGVIRAKSSRKDQRLDTAKVIGYSRDQQAYLALRPGPTSGVDFLKECVWAEADFAGHCTLGKLIRLATAATLKQSSKLSRSHECVGLLRSRWLQQKAIFAQFCARAPSVSTVCSVMTGLLQSCSLPRSCPYTALLWRFFMMNLVHW